MKKWFHCTSLGNAPAIFLQGIRVGRGEPPVYDGSVCPRGIVLRTTLAGVDKLPGLAVFEVEVPDDSKLETAGVFAFYKRDIPPDKLRLRPYEETCSDKLHSQSGNKLRTLRHIRRPRQ